MGWSFLHSQVNSSCNVPYQIFVFLPNLQPAQSFTGDSLTLQPCEKAGISHDIWVINFLLARSLENCKIFCLKQRDFHPAFCRNVQGGKKIEGSSAVSRGFLLNDRKKRLFCLKVLVCCYQACNVLQFLIGTANVTAWTMLASASWAHSRVRAPHSKTFRPKPKTQQGKQGHIPSNITPTSQTVTEDWSWGVAALLRAISNGYTEVA